MRSLVIGAAAAVSVLLGACGASMPSGAGSASSGAAGGSTGQAASASASGGGNVVSDLCAAVPTSALAEALGHPSTVCLTHDPGTVPTELQLWESDLHSSVDLAHMGATDEAGDGLYVAIQGPDVGGLQVILNGGTGVVPETFEGYPAGQAPNAGTFWVQARGDTIGIDVTHISGGYDDVAEEQSLMDTVLKVAFR